MRTICLLTALRSIAMKSSFTAYKFPLIARDSFASNKSAARGSQWSSAIALPPLLLLPAVRARARPNGNMWGADTDSPSPPLHLMQISIKNFYDLAVRDLSHRTRRGHYNIVLMDRRVTIVCFTGNIGIYSNMLVSHFRDCEIAVYRFKRYRRIICLGTSSILLRNIGIASSCD